MLPKLEWLEDPRVFRVNRLDAHSDHITYCTEDEMLCGRTSLRQSLDGQWKFRYSKCPAKRPADFWQDGFDDSDFDTITVPGHLEIQGYNHIQYINKLYDWDGHAELRPPHIDWEYDPTGSYVNYFDLDEGLRGKRVCISFQGAEQAIYVWLNGQFVGYSEDSFTPSEFDLTPYIKDTGNRLCVELYKRSSAAWLEDQDFFSFSGLFRSVYLYAKMPVSVDDLWLNTSLDADLHTGHLCVRVKCDTMPRMHLSLTHPELGSVCDCELSFTQKDGFYFSQNLDFPDVRLWDYGTPELYHAVLSVENGGFIPYDIGFRRFEIVDKIMLLNGRRLMLAGVNRHEWNPATGRCITQADMDEAMKTIEENHFNAVRTCHYPDRSEWYFMCDKKGIYLMDETNMETHGSWQKGMTPNPEWNIPASLPEWLDCVLDRANSMFQRDKNHVAILFWSCGNESYAGTDIVAISDFFHSQDPSRIVHYEGVYWCREFDYLSDVESRMYATPTEVREYLENDPKKPFIHCEYMHCMGNSLGGMESYVNLGEEFPMYQGGFVWDFMDQALWHKNAQGKTVLGYGGDFFDRHSDYNFSANGIVFADGKPKPCMQEIRYWNRPLDFRRSWDNANREAEKNAPPLKIPAKTQPLKLVDGDGSFGVRGEDFEVLFSKDCSGPASIISGKREWIWRAPRLAFWRAPTENDIGASFPQKSAIWSAVEGWQTCLGYEVLCYTEDAFELRYDYSSNVMPDLRASVTYRLERSGIISVRCDYEGKPGRPQLAVFGLRFATPLPVDEIKWLGLSGETYPDRYKGAKFGTFTEQPHIPDYLVPQECGNHYNTRSFTLTRGKAKLSFECDGEPFSFSAIPYTPAQLTDAFHKDELPEPCRTVITVLSDMRGVGGIDTWMTDVEPQYHISAEENHSLKFKMYL